MNNANQVKEIVKWFIDSCDIGNTPEQKEIIRKLNRLGLSEHDIDFAFEKLRFEYESINDLKAKRTRISGRMGWFFSYIPL